MFLFGWGVGKGRLRYSLAHRLEMGFLPLCILVLVFFWDNPFLAVLWPVVDLLCLFVWFVCLSVCLFVCSLVFADWTFWQV